MADSEKSVSISFSDEHGANLQLSVDENDHMNGNKPNIVSPATINHRSFMKSAPSLMQLLAIGNDKFTENKPVSTLEPIADTENTYSNIDLQALALKAAQEFETLTTENDKLFRAKEQYKQQYDDMMHQMNDLQTQLSETQQYKDEHDRLVNEMHNYDAKIKIYEQEKVILQETIQDLKSKSIENGQDNMNGYNDPDIMDMDTNPHLQSHSSKASEQEERLMVQITQLTKEKNKMEEEMDAFKLVITDESNNIDAINQKLLDSEAECKRLSDNLTAQQDKYIQLEQSKNQQRHRYARKMTVTSNDMESEHIAKQMQLKRKLEEQQKKIAELTQENQELNTEKFSKKQRRNSLGKKIKHLRLRTKNNLFGGDETFDADPFGAANDYDVNEEAYNGNEEEYNGSSGEDNGGVYIHGAQSSVMVHDLINDMNTPMMGNDDENDTQDNFIMPAHKATDSMEITQLPNTGSCACFFSFFNKFKKDKGSEIKPLAAQEMRD